MITTHLLRCGVVAKLAALAFLTGAGQAEAQIHISVQEETIVNGAKAVAGLIPKPVGSMLSGAVGLMFSSADARHKELRDEWEAYTNQKIGALALKRDTENSEAYERSIESITAAIDSGDVKLTTSRWEAPHQDLVREVPKFRSGDDEKATEHLPLYLGASSLHLTALSQLTAIKQRERDLTLRDSYSREYKKYLHLYCAGLRDEAIKMLAERVQKVGVTVTSRSVNPFSSRGTVLHSWQVTDGAEMVGPLHAGNGSDWDAAFAARNAQRDKVWNAEAALIEALWLETDGKKWEYDGITVPPAASVGRKMWSLPYRTMTRQTLEDAFEAHQTHRPPAMHDNWFIVSLYWRYRGAGPAAEVNVGEQAGVLSSGQKTRAQLEEEWRTSGDARQPTDLDFVTSLYWRYYGTKPDADLKYHASRLLHAGGD